MHIPVLLQEVIGALDLHPGAYIIDGTAGGGGHAEALLERIHPGGTLLACDWNPQAVLRVQQRLEKAKTEHAWDVTTKVLQGSFASIPEMLPSGVQSDGLLLDLGLSSFELTDGTGFSFQDDAPLIMRYDEDASQLTAAAVVNGYTEPELVSILYKYGEERYARRIAREIVHTRKQTPIRTTQDLVRIIEDAVPARRGGIHPATRTFLALRLFVNQELEQLESILQRIPDIITHEGRVAVISFHSAEDRIVKQIFRNLVQAKQARFIHKKPITPSQEELKDNPRSRSAKLRAIQRI